MDRPTTCPRPAARPGQGTVAVEPTFDVRDQTEAFPRREPADARRRAPRTCCVVLIDDMGFGAPSAFGGPCRMPTADAAGRRRPALLAASTSPPCARRPARR